MFNELRRTELAQLYRERLLTELIASIHDNPEVFNFHSNRAAEWYTSLYNLLSPYSPVSMKQSAVDKLLSNPKAAWEEAFGPLDDPERQQAIKDYMDRSKADARKRQGSGVIY